MDALGAHPQLRYVLGLQEEIVVAMADGAARASNRSGAHAKRARCPGLGNAMGSLFNAKWYGSPLLITAGQQEQGHGLDGQVPHGVAPPAQFHFVPARIRYASATMPSLVNRSAPTPPRVPLSSELDT